AAGAALPDLSGAVRSRKAVGYPAGRPESSAEGRPAGADGGGRRRAVLRRDDAGLDAGECGEGGGRTLRGAGPNRRSPRPAEPAESRWGGGARSSATAPAQPPLGRQRAKPPSVCRTWPVIQRASSVQSQEISRAGSSGSP